MAGTSRGQHWAPSGERSLAAFTVYDRRDGLSLQACSEIELIPMRRSLCDIDGERYAFGSVRCLARPGAAQLILGQQAHKPL